MKKISGYAALIAVPTFIASVYGMNFEHMPELDWPVGYPLALLVMAISVALPLPLLQPRRLDLSPASGGITPRYADRVTFPLAHVGATFAPLEALPLIVAAVLYAKRAARPSPSAAGRCRSGARPASARGLR